MKNKTELENEFNVADGIIQNLGKFEGEPLSTPFYYYIILEMGGDLVTIEEEDYDLFDDIPHGCKYAYVEEDNQGFVTIEFTNDPFYRCKNV